MTLLALLRHGETAWTAERRIQGRTDIPLSEAGRKMISSYDLPATCKGMTVVTSPLVRCTETAALLGFADARREPRLAEMHWGAWEGRKLPELRDTLGDAMRENEARGWDFRPEGGETPREVYARVGSWLCELEAPTFAVTHRGVIRAILAVATGWDLRGKPPVKLDWNAVHLFRIGDGGEPIVEQVNAR